MALGENILRFLVQFSTNPHVIIGVVTILLFAIFWYTNSSKDRPPGPLGVPFLGYLPFIGARPNHTFSELAKIYGPVFSFYVGNTLVVILNNHEAIKEAFIKQGDSFAGRPLGFIFNLVENDKYNVIIADGNTWKDHRRFALTLLRDCGVGKFSIEPLLMDEIQHFLNELRKYDGKSTDFAEQLSLSASNNICILIFGKRFKYDDPWFVFAKRFFSEMGSLSSMFTIFEFFPWTRKIPGLAKVLKLDSSFKSLDKFKKSVIDMINEKKKHHVDGSRGNYMDAFITEQKSRDSKGCLDDVFSDEALEDNIRSMMSAGTGTTSNTLLWCLIYMMGHPEVQKKVQGEIDRVIGRERTPCWNDRLRTPYIEATIQEVQRIATLAEDGVPHRNTEDCVILGHTIPKNSFVVANLWAVHNDVEIWKDPRNFRPERFISENGELLNKESFMPFSVGKRQCMGISLARMEIYLYFTSMLQNFTFLSPDGSAPNMEGTHGFVFYPKVFKTRVLARNTK